MDFYYSHFINEKTEATRKLRNLPKVTQLGVRNQTSQTGNGSQRKDADDKLLSVGREALGVALP